MARTDLPQRIQALYGEPHWRVLIRPREFNASAISSRTECRRLVERAAVRLRGTDYPYVTHRADAHETGSDWAACWNDFMGHVTYWRQYQSGQFFNIFGVREVLDAEWAAKLDEKARRDIRGTPQNFDWDTVPGFFDLINTLYIVTEIFEFAARLAESPAFATGCSITVELHNLREFVLGNSDFNRAWGRFCQVTSSDLVETWEFSSADLLAKASAHAVQATSWVYEGFGYLKDDQNLEALREAQATFRPL